MTRIVTFTPGSVVPQGDDDAVVYSSGALEAFGTDDTPAGWPTRGRLIAIEVEVTATSQFNANRQVQLVVAPPATRGGPIVGSTSNASGTWSGWQGEIRRYRVTDVDGYSLDKFGGWLTDHISFNTSAIASNRLTTPDPTTGGGSDIDIRVRCRRDPWVQAGSDGTIAGQWTGGNQGRWQFGITEDDIEVRLGANISQSFLFPLGDFDLTDGEWVWLRFTYNDTDRLTVYDSVDGNTWNQRGTNATTDLTSSLRNTDPQVRVGNQSNAADGGREGFNGDISHFDAYNGTTLWQTLTLDAMTAQNDLTWTPDVGADWTAGWDSAQAADKVNGSTIPDTKRVRFEPDTAYPITDVRLIVDAQIGELTVDEIQLEYIDRRVRRALGLRR